MKETLSRYSHPSCFVFSMTLLSVKISCQFINHFVCLSTLNKALQGHYFKYLLTVSANISNMQ